MIGYITSGANNFLAAAAFYEVYAKAIEHGRPDEGKPGLRPYSAGFYAAYFRDVDGNKLNASCFEESNLESFRKDVRPF